jgi:calcineurin-like phosphoesterase family protein
MSVYFTSDPHLGHKNIARFRSFVQSTEHNTKLFVDSWNQTITKNDLVYILGDVAFDEESLEILSTLKGRKVLIKGNHDNLVSTALQSKVFEEIHGMISYKRFWLSHCPIHPVEIRGRVANIHGHVHSNSITLENDNSVLDTRYFNACVDILYPTYHSMFISLEKLNEIYK